MDPATAVKAVGRGKYLVRDNNGREATFNQKNLAQTRVEVPFLPPQPRSSSVPQLNAQNVGLPSKELQASISLPELVPIELQVTERRSSRRTEPTRRLLTEIQLAYEARRRYVEKAPTGSLHGRQSLIRLVVSFHKVTLGDSITHAPAKIAEMQKNSSHRFSG